MYANGCRCQKSKCLVHSCECLKVCIPYIFCFDLQPIFTTSSNHARAKHVFANMIKQHIASTIICVFFNCIHHSSQLTLKGEHSSSVHNT